MNIFEEVKNRVKITDVCNLLGIKLDKHYKTLCVFHKEHTPSFSVLPDKNIFFCFGCGEKGDCITLTSKLLNISPLEAVKYLNDMFHLGLNIQGKKPNMEKVNRYAQLQKSKKEFKEKENKIFQLLCDYYHKLIEWKDIKDPENRKYIFALKEIDYISYVIDEIFIYGTIKDKNYFIKDERKVVDRVCKMMKI